MALPTLPMAEVFDIQLGKMLDAAGNRGEPYPYLANRSVQWDRCVVDDLPTMRVSAEDRKRFSLVPGDLLVCEGGEVGRTAVWRGEVEGCLYQKAIHRLRARRETDSRFALHYMRWAAGRGVFRHLTTATSIAHLTKEKLETAPFPDVRITEQRRIAAILDKADAIRRKRQEAIALTDELLRSAFLEMFGDPVSNPKGWPSAPLGTLARFVGGGTPSRQNAAYFDGDLCWATPKDMRGEVLTDTEEHITELALQGSAAKVVPPDTLLVVVKSKVLAHRLPVLRTAIRTCFGQDLKGICLHDSALVRYVHRHMLIGQSVLLERARGLNTEGLTLEHLREYEVMLPPETLVSKFTGIERRLEGLVQRERTCLSEATALCDSLSDRAFSGEL